jgi:hypothetical protein
LTGPGDGLHCWLASAALVQIAVHMRRLTET